jgi:IS5 family transposase
VTVTEAGRVLTQTAGQEAEADAAAPVTAVSEVGVERVVADKGYDSQLLLQELAEVGVRTLIAEPERRRQRWEGQRAAQAAGYANRRLKTESGTALMKRRGPLIERLLPIRTTRAACAGCTCAAKTLSPSGC